MCGSRRPDHPPGSARIRPEAQHPRQRLWAHKQKARGSKKRRGAPKISSSLWEATNPNGAHEVGALTIGPRPNHEKEPLGFGSAHPAVNPSFPQRTKASSGPTKSVNAGTSTEAPRRCRAKTNRSRSNPERSVRRQASSSLVGQGRESKASNGHEGHQLRLLPPRAGQGQPGESRDGNFSITSFRQPTDPSISISKSRFSSTAYSMGKFFGERLKKTVHDHERRLMLAQPSALKIEQAAPRRFSTPWPRGPWRHLPHRFQWSGRCRTGRLFVQGSARRTARWICTRGPAHNFHQPAIAGPPAVFRNGFRRHHAGGVGRRVNNFGPRVLVLVFAGETPPKDFPPGPSPTR
jgi:hypothetical protein